MEKVIMLRKLLTLVFFCVFLDFKIVNSQPKLRKLESQLNLLQSKFSMLENKVFKDELDFRDDMDTIFNQLNKTVHGGIAHNSKPSNSRNASIDSSHENAEALNKVKAIQDGFESEKRYIRSQLKEFEDALKDMQLQLKNATAELLENVDNRLNDIESRISNSRSHIMNLVRGEMETDIAWIKQNFSTELEVSKTSQKEVNVLVEELKENISKNKEVLDDSQEQVKKMQSTIDNINEAPIFDCGSWKRFGMSCYKLFHDEVSWDDAVRKCTAEEAYLAEIETSDENRFIINLLDHKENETDVAENQYNYEYAFEDYLFNLEEIAVKTGPWIGASDKDSEGKWIWEYNRRHMNKTFHSWNEGEPNGGIRENCLHLYEYLSYNWNDSPCDGMKPYVCKKAATVK